MKAKYKKILTDFLVATPKIGLFCLVLVVIARIFVNAPQDLKGLLVVSIWTAIIVWAVSEQEQAKKDREESERAAANECKKKGTDATEEDR